MKKYTKILMSVTAAPLAAVVLFAGCALQELGQTPEDVSFYKTLPYFADGKFRNQKDTPYYPHRVSGGKAGWLRHLMPSPNVPKAPFTFLVIPIPRVTAVCGQVISIS